MNASAPDSTPPADLTPPPEDAALPPVAADRYVPPFSKRVMLFPHVFLLIICSLVMVMSFAMRAEGEQNVFLPFAESPIPGTCMSNELLGIECPGCGMTRCFIHLSHGRLDRAWHFNPAGFLLYLLIAVQIPFRIIQIVRIQQGRPELWQGRFTWVLWVIAGALVIQWLVGMVADRFA